MSDPQDTIPYGFCHCGCGRKTALALYNYSSRGYVKGEPRRYCRGCNGRIRKSPTNWVEEDRGYLTPCWIWNPANRNERYGVARTAPGPNQVLAHRFVYASIKGPIPEGMQLDHLCRVRRCVNPDHLEPVPNEVNVQRSSAAKLAPESVREIRQLAGTKSIRDLSEQFGVDYDTVSNVIRRKTWKNVI